MNGYIVSMVYYLEDLGGKGVKSFTKDTQFCYI